MLRDVRIDPSNGQKPEKLVIFLHGYISCGDAMAQYMGPTLAQELPDTKLVFPDAPIGLCYDWENPDDSRYRSWFDIQDIVDSGTEYPDPDLIHARAHAAVDDINAYIDRVIAEEGVDPKQVVLAGFSQGAHMAVHAALSREPHEKLGGVFSLSGLALHTIQPHNKLPMAILAGKDEPSDSCGYPSVARNKAYFEGMGYDVSTALVPDSGHEIKPWAMKALAVFTRHYAKRPQARTQPALRIKSPGMS